MTPSFLQTIGSPPLFSSTGTSTGFPISQPAHNKEVKVEFRDGQSALIQRDHLEKIERFNPVNSNGMEVEDLFDVLKEYNSSEFNLILSLVIENKPMQEALPAECYQNPHIYEILDHLFQFFLPKTHGSLLDELKENILPYWMSPDAARYVLEAYCEECSQEKVLEQIENKTAPVSVQVAHAVISNLIYTESDVDAAKRHEEAKAARNEILEWKKEKQSLEKTLAVANPGSPQQILGQGAWDACNKKITELEEAQRKSNGYYCSFPHREKEYAESSSLLLRKMADAAMLSYNAYKKELLLALTKSGANLEEGAHHLLPWLIGPKAFFCKYYDIDVRGGRFIHMPTLSKGFRYALQNPGPYQLEEEFRTDLKSYANDLPPRLTSDQTPTAPVSEEVKSLQKELIPKIKNWGGLEVEDKREIVAKLYAFNKWDQYKAESFLGLSFESCDETLAKGRFSCMQRGDYFPSCLNIILTFHNFMLIINDGRNSNPDSISTAYWLERNLYKIGEQDPRELYRAELASMMERQRANPLRRLATSIANMLGFNE